jgi:hypothetical protein
VTVPCLLIGTAIAMLQYCNTAKVCHGESSSLLRQGYDGHAVWTASAEAIPIALSRPGQSRALPHAPIPKDHIIFEMV